jgi:hypothetical protein
MSLRFQHRDKLLVLSTNSKPPKRQLRRIFKPVIRGLNAKLQIQYRSFGPVAPTELDAARNNSIKVQCLTAFDAKAFPFSPTRHLKSGFPMRRLHWISFRFHEPCLFVCKPTRKSYEITVRPSIPPSAGLGFFCRSRMGNPKG